MLSARLPIDLGSTRAYLGQYNIIFNYCTIVLGIMRSNLKLLYFTNLMQGCMNDSLI